VQIVVVKAGFRIASGFLDRLQRFLVRLSVLMILTFVVVTGAVALLRHALRPDTFARWRLERDGYSVDVASVHRALERGDTLSLARLKIAGVPLDAADEGGLTPFQKAVVQDRADLLQALADLGVAVDLSEIGGRPAVARALEKGAWGIAEYLLANGASPNLEMEPGLPALVWSIREEKREAFELLAKRGASPRLGTARETPLALAVRLNAGWAVDRLLALGVPADGDAATGLPLAVQALRDGRRDLARQLLEAGAAPARRGEMGPSLVEASFESRDRELFLACLARGARIAEARGPDGRGLLEAACRSGDLDWVDLLLAQGENPAQRTGAGEPLWWAELREGRPLVAECLLGAGASVDAELSDGRKPVERAVADRDFRLLRYLLARGASVRDSLWEPLRTRSYDVMRLLAANGEDLGNPTSTGMTLLGHAVMSGDLTGAALLLEYGARVEPSDRPGGHTLLEWAIANRQTAMAELLIARGADANERVTSPVSAAYLEKFRENGSLSYHLKNDSQLTPIMLAAGSKQLEMAKLLLDKGASRSRASRHRTYPVTFAINAKDLPMAQLMLGREPEVDGKHKRKFVVSLSDQRVRFYRDGILETSSACSTGKNGFRTPRGTFVITDKARLRYSTLYGSAMPFFMRLSGSAVGMHQGHCPGYPASHGCIRLPYTYAQKFFQVGQVGDIVVVE
jgi:ankyrin repeat protein